MIDVVTTDKEVKITVGMHGVSKDKIKIDAYESTLDVKSEDPQRKYHKTIDLPLEADVETAKSRYNNGMLSRKVRRIVRTSKCSTESHIFGRGLSYFVKWFTYWIGVVHIVAPPFSTAL